MTKVKTVSELLFGLIYFNLFFGIAALPGVVVLPNIFVLLFLLPIVPVYQYLRGKITYMAGIILTHMFIPVVLFIIADSWLIRIIMVGFALLYSIFSISRLNKPQGVLALSFSATSACIFFALVGIAFYNGLVFLMLLYPVLIVISIILTIVHRIISRTDESLSVIRASSAGNTKKIIRFNYILAIATGVAIVLLALLLFFVIVRPTLTTIYDNLPQLGREARQREPVDNVHEIGADSIAAPGLTFEPAERETHWLAQLLLHLLFILGIIFFIGVIIFIIFHIVKYIFGFLSLKSQKTSEDIALLGTFEDEKEFIYNRKRIFKKSLRDLHPIRRAFYEKILRYKKKGLKFDPSDTPTELAEKITTEDINELVIEYKNIRYGVFES